MKTTKNNYGVVAPLLTAAAILLSGCGDETGRSDSAALSPDAPVNSPAESDDAPKPASEIQIRSLGEKPSEDYEDMESYLKETYLAGLDPDVLNSENEELDRLTHEEFLKREDEFMNNGVLDVACGAMNGKVYFAANFISRGVFDFTIDDDGDLETTAEKFGAGLDKLISLLRELD
ncbi:MAG: hypothetical protein IJL92_06895 [Thermoguttaceae bacterium]|nr:hypothetical protein [Thermoguttaceae bacterium]